MGNQVDAMRNLSIDTCLIQWETIRSRRRWGETKFYNEEKDTSEPASIGDVLGYYWDSLKYYRKAKKRANIGIALALAGIGIAVLPLLL